MSDPGQPSVASSPGGATRIRLAPVAVLAVIVAALTGLLFAVPAASASPLVGARNAVGVIVQPAGQVVGVHEPILAGESRQRAPGYDQTTVGSCVAPEEAAASGRSVDEVLNSLPKGNQSFVRTVPDEGALQSTFDELTQGGTPTTWKGYDGSVYELQDGTQIGIRGSSSSGGATIDTRNPDGSINKIHLAP